MKCNKLILPFLTVFSMTLYSQTEKTCDHSASGQSVRLSKDQTIESWYGNASFYSASITIKGADSLIYDSKIKKLFAYNFKEYKFKERTFVPGSKTKMQRLEYTLGDPLVYVE